MSRYATDLLRRGTENSTSNYYHGLPNRYFQVDCLKYTSIRMPGTRYVFLFVLGMVFGMTLLG